MDRIKTKSGCCKLSKLLATAATVAMNYKKALIAPGWHFKTYVLLESSLLKTIVCQWTIQVHSNSKNEPPLLNEVER